MKNVTILFTLAVLLFSFATRTQAIDFYANDVVSSSLFDLVAPQNALGEPDGLYAAFNAQGTSLVLDMGEGEEGWDGVLVYASPLDLGSVVRVTLTTADDEILTTETHTFTSGETEWYVVHHSTQQFRYVEFESVENESWRLDALQAIAISTPETSTPEEPTDDGTVDENADEEVRYDDYPDAATLIKLADGNTIYFLDSDGIRHPFPNEITFFSWDYTFDQVVTVDAATMASYMIGDSVTVNSGSYLVKLQSVPKVYAVAPDRTLRWLVSEEVAEEIYGADWADQVIDISDAFWTDYTEGAPIDSADDAADWEVEYSPF